MNLNEAQRWYLESIALMAKLVPMNAQQVIMIDANARSPMEKSSAFGLQGATTASKTTGDLELLALAGGLWAPALFVEYVDQRRLQGTFHFDELPPLTRIDFVMLGGAV